MIWKAVASGKDKPFFLGDQTGPEDAPSRDEITQSYMIAYGRLSRHTPILMSEIVAYHRDFNLAYSLDSSVEIILSLESDDVKARLKKAETKINKRNPRG